MSKRTKHAAGLLAVAATLALPALAGAQPEDRPDQGGGERSEQVTEQSPSQNEQGSRRGEERSEERSARRATWVLKGKVMDKDGTNVTILVARASRHNRALRGRLVTVDLSAARLLVRDVNGDGVNNVDDVSVEDFAKIHAKHPRRARAVIGQPIQALHAKFRPGPRPDGGEEAPSTESAEA